MLLSKSPVCIPIPSRVHIQDAAKDLNFLTKNFSDFLFYPLLDCCMHLKALARIRTAIGRLQIYSPTISGQGHIKNSMIELYRISPSMFTYWLLYIFIYYNTHFYNPNLLFSNQIYWERHLA
jgi:hypothetical protein